MQRRSKAAAVDQQAAGWKGPDAGGGAGAALPVLGINFQRISRNGMLLVVLGVFFYFLSRFFF